MKGLENSMTLSLEAVMVRSAAITSISFLSNIPTSPVQPPPALCSTPYLSSWLSTREKVKLPRTDISFTMSTMNPS